MRTLLTVMGVAALTSGVMLPCFTAQAAAPLSYRAVIGSTQDNRLFCRNCGGSAKRAWIQGAGDAGQYHFVIETPYYTFLARSGQDACPYASWIAINKTRTAPYAESFTVGCYPLQDFRAVDEQGATRLRLSLRSGVSETMAFSH